MSSLAPPPLIERFAEVGGRSSQRQLIGIYVRKAALPDCPTIRTKLMRQFSAPARDCCVFDHALGAPAFAAPQLDSGHDGQRTLRA